MQISAQSIANSGIYLIENTLNGKKYIGQAVDIEDRWKQHQRDLNGDRHANCHLQASWNKYGSKIFTFEVLEYCSPEELNDREIYFITFHKSRELGYNQTDGGGGRRGWIPTEETRLKISSANRGKPRTDEFRQKMSAANKGKTLSEEHRLKMSKAHKHQPPVSEETRQKMSESAKNRPPISEETRRKIGEANKRRSPASDETRRKLSEAGLGRIVSEETRKKISEAPGHQNSEVRRKKSEAAKGNQHMLGKKHSDESRRKMSEAVKRRWAAKKLAEAEKELSCAESRI